MNISSLQPLNTKYMRIAYVAILASILLVASLTIAPSLASDDDNNDVVEFFGSGTIESTTVRTAEPLSACVDLVTRTGTRVWTGIVDGTASNTLLKAVTDNCDMHGQGRLIYMFTDVTIKPDQSDPSTWITGGAVVEGTIDFILTAPFPAGGVFKSESEHRFLCGTGDLEGIHGVGVSSASASLTAVSLDYLMWIHFDDHETGFEFLCDVLDNNDSD